VKNKKIFALLASVLVCASIFSPVNSMAASQVTINYWTHVNPPANDLEKILIQEDGLVSQNLLVY
jgi:ABC-type glycerol-3-phosphate transport system substrate-binding protein